MTERLVSTAIKRDGKLWQGFKSHWELRNAMGDLDSTKSKPGDEEGFVTSADRFVSRREAIDVGIAAGQLDRQWLGALRALLSSDINW